MGDLDMNKKDLLKIMDISKAFNEICKLWESIEYCDYNIKNISDEEAHRLCEGINSILLKLNDKYSLTH